MFFRSWEILQTVESMAKTAGVPSMKSIVDSIMIMAAMAGLNVVYVMVVGKDIMSQISH